MKHEEIRRELAARLVKLLADMSHLPKELRHYQREAIEATLGWLNDPNGTKRAYIEHATGLGKTELFAAIVSACIGMRTLIIVPSKLLLEQTVRRIHQFTKGMLGHMSSLKSIKDKDDKNGEIIAIRGHEHFNVVVAVGASFKRYAHKLAQEFNPQLIIRDECHWSYPEPEQRALALFPEAVMLGLSATPDYLGTTGREGYIPVTLDNGQVLYAPADLLGQTHFQTRLDQRSVRWGIENGWLAPLAWGHIDFDVSLDKVPLQATREGGMDYKPEELQSLLSRHWPFMLETVVRLYKEGEYDLPNRQTVSICASVREAEQLAEAVKGAGIPAACITGSTPTKERNKLLAAYKAGDLKFLSSVMVLREGWDSPNAEVCMMLRPTRSRVFYVQSMGRVLRLPLDGSFKVALILDAYFLNTHYAPLSAPVLFGQPGMQYVDGEILIDRATNIPTVSPYVKPNIKPRIVVVPDGSQIEWTKGCIKEFYLYPEAVKRVKELKITNKVEYGKRYREDPKLPSSPPYSYPAEWISWGSFFGREARPEFYSYAEASAKARELGIKTSSEYTKTYKKDPRLPCEPENTYKSTGWTSWDDFLGREARPEFYSYAEASAKAKELGIKSCIEYGTFRTHDQRLPSEPWETYKSTGWTSWDDFLGREARPEFYSYAEASAKAKELGIGKSTEYTELSRQDPKLPFSPDKVYAKTGWISWPAFLGGNKKRRTTMRSAYTYAEASAKAKELGIKTSVHYKKLCRRDVRLPSDPKSAYADSGWTSWAEFLGVTDEDRKLRRGLRYNLLPYAEASAKAKELGIANSSEYNERYRSCSGLPAVPARVYADTGWTSWDAFLGREARPEFYSYAEASAKAKELGITSAAEYKGLCQQDPKLPANPDMVYADTGWTSWGKFLGTGRELTRQRVVFYSYAEASAKVKELGIKTWSGYKKVYQQDPKLPSEPYNTYKSTGWTSWNAFFGLHERPEFYSYAEASAKAKELGIRSSTEYKKVYQQDLKLPRRPQEFYANTGWTTWDAFLARPEFYSYAEASAKAKELGCKSMREYKKRRSADPRLPSKPFVTYADSGWNSWDAFLGREARPEFYSYAEASAKAKELGIKSSDEYNKLYRQDGRLPSRPHVIYAKTGWTSWPAFLARVQ